MIGEGRPDLVGGANPNDMTKHNALPGRRKRWGLPQRNLAHLVGVSPSLISRYEHGGLPPSARSMLAFEVIFGRGGRHLFPTLYADVQDDVMRHAAKLDRALSKKKDPVSALQRKLLSDMVSRNEPARGV